MKAIKIQGDWLLAASANTTSQIAFDENDEPVPDGVEKWLNGFDEVLIESATPTQGMLLTIMGSGSFTERLTGSPNVSWFDVEGVLIEEVVPFDGVIMEGVECAYLRPVTIAGWAVPMEGRYAKAIFRYDDGDTKITDEVRLIDGRLIRTVNVVTDELYLDRVVLVYERDLASA